MDEFTNPHLCGQDTCSCDWCGRELALGVTRHWCSEGCLDALNGETMLDEKLEWEVQCE